MTKTLAVLTLLCLTSTTVTAKGTQPAAACAHVFGQGQRAVRVTAGRTELLCYRAIAVLHSNQTRSALWSARRLTR
ncbi:hypothetical protein AU476_06240 [Cupriavidus sp. UYMSc13B]|nr:hypothetical protein AU476_06240 [Cupriavidus sp. UYMSc13B]